MPGRKISDVSRYEVTSIQPNSVSWQGTISPTAALLEYSIVLLEYLDLFHYQWQGTANIWEGLGPARPPLATPLLLLLCAYINYLV